MRLCGENRAQLPIGFHETFGDLLHQFPFLQSMINGEPDR